MSDESFERFSIFSHVLDGHTFGGTTRVPAYLFKSAKNPTYFAYGGWLGDQGHVSGSDAFDEAHL
jgi:hypothetical protein